MSDGRATILAIAATFLGSDFGTKALHLSNRFCNARVALFSLRPYSLAHVERLATIVSRFHTVALIRASYDATR